MSLNAKAACALTAGMLSLALVGCTSSSNTNSMTQSAQSIDTAALSNFESTIDKYDEVAIKTKKTVDTPEAIAAANLARSDLSAVLDTCEEVVQSAKDLKDTMTTIEVNVKSNQINNCLVKINDKSEAIDQQIELFAKAREEEKINSQKKAEEEANKNFYRNDLEEKFYDNIERNQNLSYERFRNAKNFREEIGGEYLYPSESPSPSPSKSPSPTSSSSPSPSPSVTTSPSQSEWAAPEAPVSEDIGPESPSSSSDSE